MVVFKPLRKVRVSAEGHRVSTFELFFDLVFVFAFTQTTELMSDERTAYGVLQGLIILGLLWWSWVIYSWLCNQAHADEGIMRVGMLAAMATMFLATLAIPEAFSPSGSGMRGSLVLAVTYAIVRAIHTALYIIAADDDQALRKQIVRSSTATVVGSGLIIAGALIGGEAQTWLWLAGLLADLALTYALARRSDWRIRSAVHWTERYGLIVMLALGESIIALGVGASELPVDTAILVGALLGIGLSVCLWWLYFDMIALEAEHVFAGLQGRERASMATDAYSYLHFFIIAGIILSALGVETALAHIDDEVRFGWFGSSHLLGGTALYLVGHALFWKRVGGTWKRWRLLTAALLLALIPAGAFVPPLTAMVLVVGLCCALVAFETTLNAEDRATVRGRV